MPPPIVAAAPSSSSSSPLAPPPPPILPATGGEPDLSSCPCTGESDRMTLRNVIYTLWAVNKSSDSAASSPSCYVGYNVRRLEGRGYLILAFFGEGCRISLQDMQLISDVCPLRIDSMFVRGVQPGDFPSGGSAGDRQRKVAIVLSICVLDANQPVRITEAEVVRVRKRSRGLLGSLLSFGAKS